MRASSCSARAGTLASKLPASGASSVVSMTLRRYESVATIRSSCPEADTRIPVSTGRVSSRDAERATFATVSANAWAGTLDTRLLVRNRQRREVVEAQRAQVERRRAGDDLEVLLGAAQLERHRVRGQRSHDIEEQPSRNDHLARSLYLRLQRHSQPNLRVGGEQLGRSRSPRA